MLLFSTSIYFSVLPVLIVFWFFCMDIFFLPFSFGCCWFVCFFRNVNESMYSISYLVIKSKLYNFIEFLIFFLFLFVLILSSMAEFVSVNACVNEWVSEWLHLPRTLLIIQNQRIKIWIHFKSDEYYGNPRDQHIRSANDWCDMHNKRYFPSHTYQPLRARPIKFQLFHSGSRCSSHSITCCSCNSHSFSQARRHIINGRIRIRINDETTLLAMIYIKEHKMFKFEPLYRKYV